MNIDLAHLPDDVEELQRMVRSPAAERTALSEAQAEIERLRLIVQKLQCSSLAGGPSGSITTSCSSALKTSKPISRELKPSFHQRRINHLSPPKVDRSSLPAHLPREDLQLNIEHKACPCCGGALHLIGETASEMLDHAPARLRVIRIRRFRYGLPGLWNHSPGGHLGAPDRQGGWPHPVFSPMSSSPSIAIISRCTGRARSLLGMALSSTARRWPTDASS